MTIRLPPSDIKVIIMATLGFQYKSNTVNILKTAVAIQTLYSGIYPLHWTVATDDSLQWRHNEHDGVSNHRRLDCLPNRLFWRR